MNIVIGADFVPTESNEKFFCDGDSEYLLGKELSLLVKNADYSIFNLECPLYDSDTPVLKHGPCLRANTKSVNLYKNLSVGLLSLANNHIMDHGVEGLFSTMNSLKSANIDFTGAGLNLSEACKYHIKNINGINIGIYTCVEHEFSIASIINPGANPFSVFESYKAVSELKNNCEYVIVLYHGGKEHFRYPSPELQLNCRMFIDNGADLVVCQHSHCIGCKEDYHNGVIVYGQGNFLFDNSNSQFWKTSVLLQIIDGKVEFVPLVKDNEKVRIAFGKEADDIIDGFNKRSNEICQNNFVSDRFCLESSELLYEYLWAISGAKNSVLLRAINRISNYKFYKKYIDRKYGLKALCNILNCFECESHREIIVTAIKNRLNQYNHRNK